MHGLDRPNAAIAGIQINIVNRSYEVEECKYHEDINLNLQHVSTAAWLADWYSRDRLFEQL